MSVGKRFTLRALFKQRVFFSVARACFMGMYFVVRAKEAAMAEEHRPFTSPEDLGESQVQDAAQVASQGGPAGTGQGGYRQIADEGEYEYHLKHQTPAGVDEDNPYDPAAMAEPREEAPDPEDIVSNAEFRRAVEGLQESRCKKRQQQQKKSA